MFFALSKIIKVEVSVISQAEGVFSLEFSIYNNPPTTMICHTNNI